MCLIRGRVAGIVVIAVRHSSVASLPYIGIVGELRSGLACMLSIVFGQLTPKLRIALGRLVLLRLFITRRITPIFILVL